MTPDPKGFTCECGTWHAFGVYVAAHWTLELRHTCPNCGAVHLVEAGEVELIEPGKPKKEKP